MMRKKKTVQNGCKTRPRANLISKLSRCVFTLSYRTVLIPNYSG